LARKIIGLLSKLKQAKMDKNVSLEYKRFNLLRLQEAEDKVLPFSKLFKNKGLYRPLLLWAYNTTKDIYSYLPLRKNGQDPFLHPTNIVIYLQRARISDPLTLTAAMLHDYVEEKVDKFVEELNIKKDKEGMHMIAEYELSVFEELEGELEEIAFKNNLPISEMYDIIEIIKLLTRHKQHFYYSSMGGIFSYVNKDIKRRAIQVKLADRIHNILSIECFNEEDRIYQCFKNLFILNNVKMYLLKAYGPKIFTTQKFVPCERLFNWCGKATYDAFLTICQMCSKRGIKEVKPLLHFALKKYLFEKEGLFQATDVDPKETHPIRLFQGIVKKYDQRLHREMVKFEKSKEAEKRYCGRFFRDYNFNKEQLQALIDYKDAYALREYIAQLIYLPSFYTTNFLTSKLSKAGRIKLAQKKAVSRVFPSYFWSKLF
jgi:hypothetical protein